MALIESIEYASTQHNIASFAIKKYTVIKRDGVVVSRSAPETRAVNPGDDISMYPSEIQGVCNGYWTDEIVAAYEVSLPQEEE